VVPFNETGEAEDCAEISFTTETLDTVLECPTITTPTNGATGVSVTSSITWEAVSAADGYYVSIGTSPGGSEVVDREEVNGTGYDPAVGFEESTTYYVSVVTFNETGEAEGCAEINFSTGTLDTAPGCATIISPVDGQEDVTLNASITWEAVPNSEGYYVSIGTSPGGSEVVDWEEVNGTGYDPAVGFEENTTYYVSVVPFNETGEAEDCAEISFTTETLGTAPGCATIISPLNGATDISLYPTVSWQAVEEADGYYVSIGTTEGAGDIIDGQLIFDTVLTLEHELSENTTYYLSVTPFNGYGEAKDCSSIYFLVPTLAELFQTKYGISPNGDGINDHWDLEGIENYPDNSVSIYNRWGDKVFETDGYDNQTKVFDGVANRLSPLGAGQLPEGTYFFEILVITSGKKERVRGFIVLKR